MSIIPIIKWKKTECKFVFKEKGGYYDKRVSEKGVMGKKH